MRRASASSASSAQAEQSSAQQATAQPSAAKTSARGCGTPPTLERKAFPSRPRIRNEMLPLAPGTQSILTGTVVEDGIAHAHKIVSIVSNVTKLLDGVQTAVLYERDYQDGVLQESELAFEAQDKRGTVWNVGEYPEEYDNGKLSGAPSTWISGLRSAVGGINMPSVPRLGDAAYSQGIADKVGFHDCARVAKVGQKVCTSKQCFTGVMVSDEWSPLDPADGHQLKYYAPGIGTVRVAPVGGTAQEKLELTSHTTLSTSQLAAVDSAVMKQDKRGYRISRVYAKTAPAATH